MILNKEIKTVIETHTVEESAKIIGLKISQIKHLIYYHKLHYLPSTKHHKSEQTEKIIDALKSGNKSQSEIARDFNVSRQYVSKLKGEI